MIHNIMTMQNVAEVNIWTRLCLSQVPAQKSSFNAIQIEIKSNSIQILYFQSTAKLNKYLNVILWIKIK